MSGRSIRLATGVLGTVAALIGEAIAYGAGRPPSAAVLDLAIGLTYLYGGLAIWRRQPADRTGPLMALVGLTWYIPTLMATGTPVLFEVGLALGDTPTALLFLLILAYPRGRFETGVDRVAAGSLAIGITAVNSLQLVPFPIWINVDPGGFYVGFGLVLVATALIVRRWVVAPRRWRRELLPVLIAGLVLGITLLLNIIRRVVELPQDLDALLLSVKDFAPAAIPIALLIGFNRQSEHRLQAMVDAIPDRMFRVARDGRYLAGRTAQSAVSDASPDGRELHELMLSEAAESVRSSAANALDLDRPQAFDFSLDLPTGRREFEARVAPSGPDEVTAIVRDFTDQRAAQLELQRSSARIVEATDAERRRLERDLHDGAQQRLVSASLALRLLRARLADPGKTKDDAVSAADEAGVELKIAIAELRELARGIHPMILTEAGLGAAITALADRSGVPAAVRSLPDRRLPAAVEATAYFVVSEALANVAKYSGATGVSIRADCDASTLRVEVGDNGIGGADGSRGSGIRGLQDRVAALGGRLKIDSPPGEGTLVIAEIPIA